MLRMNEEKSSNVHFNMRILFEKRRSLSVCLLAIETLFITLRAHVWIGGWCIEQNKTVERYCYLYKKTIELFILSSFILGDLKAGFHHRYPKLYGRLDRVNFDRHVTAKL